MRYGVLVLPPPSLSRILSETGHNNDAKIYNRKQNMIYIGIHTAKKSKTYVVSVRNNA